MDSPEAGVGVRQKRRRKNKGVVAIYTKVVMLYNTEFHRLDKALQQVKRYAKLGNTEKAWKWLSRAEEILQQIENILRESS